LPLWAGFVVSGVYQDISGPAIEAVWAAPNAAIALSLGRNLAGNAVTANVPLVVPQTLSLARASEVSVLHRATRRHDETAAAAFVRPQSD